MDQQLLEKMIREVMLSMAKGESSNSNTATASNYGKTTSADYPLSKKKADTVKSATGKRLDEFTIACTGSFKFTKLSFIISYFIFKHS